MYKIYCDFDATVTVNDVWHALFERFGQPLAFRVWDEFNSGTKTAADCIRTACSTVTDADPKLANELFRTQPLRKGFIAFASFCAARDLDLRIVSDGFTGYIRPILEENGLSSIRFWANDIELTVQGTLDVQFRHQRESCRYCACCKCACLLTSSDDADTIVYIGDGYSDVCPVRMADVVFARDSLLTYCSTNGIPHHPFETFGEVEHILRNYLKDRPKYRREQAHRRRKELIMME